MTSFIRFWMPTQRILSWNSFPGEKNSPQKNNIVSLLSNVVPGVFVPGIAELCADFVFGPQIEALDLNTKNLRGNTLLMTAAEKGQATCLQALCEVKDINVNHQGQWNLTALILAATRGRKACLELLLQKEDINLNCEDDWGHTALFSAIIHGRAACQELLLQRDDINVNYENKDGRTALFLA